MRGNLRKRIVALGAQPFVTDVPELEEQLALLGSHDFQEIDAYARVGRLDMARDFARRALAVAPASAELLARVAQLDAAK